MKVISGTREPITHIDYLLNRKYLNEKRRTKITREKTFTLKERNKKNGSGQMRYSRCESRKSVFIILILKVLLPKGKW